MSRRMIAAGSITTEMYGSTPMRQWRIRISHNEEVLRARRIAVDSSRTALLRNQIDREGLMSVFMSVALEARLPLPRIQGWGK